MSAFLKVENFISLDPIYSLSCIIVLRISVSGALSTKSTDLWTCFEHLLVFDDKSDHDESDIWDFAEEIFEKYVRVESELQMNFQQVKGERLKRK